MRLIKAVCGLLALLPGAALAQPSAAILLRVAPSVLRVVGTDCAGESRSGTGFVWQRAGHIVTALHVVIGCRTVQVFFPVGDQVQAVDAAVRHELLSADLALLSVADPPQAAPLQAAAADPPIGTYVDVYGYPLDQPTSSDAPLYVTAANQTAPLLQDAVGDAEREEIQKLGFPSLSTEILRVDGNLLPGHSGAPILNDAGEVVAIGSGGLQRGTVGLGWAVRARYLRDLLAAPAVAAAPGLPTDIASNFAYVSPDAKAPHAACGDLSFVRTRTIGLADLYRSSDDPKGLLQIAASSGQPIAVFAPLRFDLWTEAKTGAGIAVPAGATLAAGPSGCWADWGDPAIGLAISGTHLQARPWTPDWIAEVQDASLAFEAGWAQPLLPYLVKDPAWSYNKPEIHAGGMLVNRSLFVGQAPGEPVPHAGFETLMAKGDAFIGIAAVNHRFLAPMLQTPPELASEASALFAVHLTTFPRSY
ncbi:S1 family peptidase [Acidisoma sp. C75]